MYSLEGKVALITGAARGQGAAEAELFVRRGAKVMVTDVRADAGKELASSLEGADYCSLDVSRERDWSAAVKATITRFGRLDILVNNAAISHFASIEETSVDDFQRVMAINLLGSFLGIRAVIPAMKQNGGSIINISSIGGLVGRRNIGAYVASKWGVRGLSKSAALELGAYKIRVNAVFPGLIDTAMTREAYGAELIASRGAQIPIGRAGTPSDIANLVLFLASDESEFCTGQEFVCDGGETSGK